MYLFLFPIYLAMDKFLKRKCNSEKNINNGPSTSRSSINSGNTEDVSTCNKIRKTYRQYSDEYISLGFTWTGEKECPIPKCVVCGVELSNSAMFPAKLNRHLTTTHANLVSKNKDYFKRLLGMQDKQAKQFKCAMTISDKAQIASYKVAELIALKLKPHTIAESLILPSCCEIVKIMFGEDAINEIMKIPLSNDTIKKRIKDMSLDIEKTVNNKLSKKFFALQIDESVDISSKAQLLAFVRFIDENEIVNQFLCCRELTGHTKGKDIFNCITTYLEKYQISWDFCVGICTDGCPSMAGSIKGCVTLVKENNPNIISTHCFLHREVLVSKTLPNTLKYVLDEVVQIVNYIKSRPLQERIFKQLCISMDAKYESLLLHTEIRWLSRGKVLCRLLELKDELLCYFRNAAVDKFAKNFENDIWCAKLAYLADIFKYLNSVNTSIQGKNENILTATDKILGFNKKILHWKNRIIKNNTLDMFPSIQTKNVADIIPAVIEHLTILEEKIECYFPSLKLESYDWIRNPFGTFEFSNLELSLQEEEEIISLSTDRSLKMEFTKLSNEQFWISVQDEYPSLSKKAIAILLQFATSYLCELGFSTLTNIKTKKRERLLDLEEEMRVAISFIRPNIGEICKTHQAQISH